MNRAVFLDRDGVLNEPIVRDGKPYPPHRFEDFHLLPGVEEACAALHDAGFRLVVATNQPDVGRGELDRELVESMHLMLRELLPIDHIEVCYDPGGERSSEFRKPKPGMLLRAAESLGIDLKSSYMVGDRWRDIDCGYAAGCRTVFIDRGYREVLRKQPDLRASDLPSAATLILSEGQTYESAANAVIGSADIVKDQLAMMTKTIDTVVNDAALESLRSLEQLNVKIFADGADKKGMLSLYENPLICGLTTNPTLMRKAGISDYEVFARDILTVVTDKPISFEVFSDKPDEMEQQARKISSWGTNVYVKIPVTNTQGESMTPLVKRLASDGVKLNVTAILTLSQVRAVADALAESVPAVVSVFAGRIADTGRDPESYMRASRCLLEDRPLAELLWASVREVLNIFQADRCGCDVVTVPHDILTKAMKLGGMDLAALSLDTVKMFASDAAGAGFSL